VSHHVVLVFSGFHADKANNTEPSEARTNSTMAASPQAHTDTTRPSPFTQKDWHQTPSAVQAYILELHDQVKELQHQCRKLQQQIEQLQGRLDKTSDTSSKPPSSDSPFKTPTRRKASSKRGAKKGHPGAGPILLEPTEVHHLYPAPCVCGHGAMGTVTPYHTHQVIELPPIRMEVSHFLLHHARCVGCGRLLKADVPREHATGYGPRLSALIGDLSGMHGTSRRLLQDFCASVLQIPISLGAIQKIIDRVSCAIVPHYEAIAEVARHATVGYIDETPWFCHHTLQWLWTMTTETVSLFLIHAHRSKEAFFDLIEDWQGILVSDGYGVYQTWVNRRQTCLAHLMRTARGVAEKSNPELAACGKWALKALQRLCHMAKAPPTGGQWQAWYAGVCHLIGRYRERCDEAGKLARRLQREMASLWVFLCEHGVEPTNNRAERSLRFGVLWRKRSGGTDSLKGNHWVERSLSLRQTCRQLGQSTFPILVDALTSLFYGRQPDLAWLC
jgi:transposase